MATDHFAAAPHAGSSVDAVAEEEVASAYAAAAVPAGGAAAAAARCHDSGVPELVRDVRGGLAVGVVGHGGGTIGQAIGLPGQGSGWP